MIMPHGGNLRELAQRAGLDRDQILDFSASINPLGPPEGLRAVLARNIDRLVHYPDPGCTELAELLARRHQVAPDQIVVGNGSTEIFFALARALRFDRAVIPVPSYADYATAVRAAGREVRLWKLQESEAFALDWRALEAELHGEELVLLGQPNNPTGRALDDEELLALAARHPATTFVVDEAFADFMAGYRSLAGRSPTNVIVVRSLTKFYAIPGLRLGFAVAAAAVARQIRDQMLPWSVNVLAQEAAVALLADEDYARRSIALIDRERTRLSEELAKLAGLCVYPERHEFPSRAARSCHRYGSGTGRSPAPSGHRHPDVHPRAASRRSVLPRGGAHGGGKRPALAIPWRPRWPCRVRREKSRLGPRR